MRPAPRPWASNMSRFINQHQASGRKPGWATPPVQPGVLSPSTRPMPGPAQSSGFQSICFEDQKFRGSQGSKEALFQRGHMTGQRIDGKGLKVPPKQAIQVPTLRDVSQPCTDRSWKIRRHRSMYRTLANSPGSRSRLSESTPRHRALPFRSDLRPVTSPLRPPCLHLSKEDDHCLCLSVSWRVDSPS